MNGAEKDNSKIGNRKSKMSLTTQRALYAEWGEFSRNNAGPEGLTERDWRLYWTNGRLAARGQRSVESWTDLSERNARYLLKVLREETGEGPAYRAELICRMARAVWSDEVCLSAVTMRSFDRFGVTDLRDLSPADAHALMEELLSRIARKEIAMADDDASEGAVLEHKIEEVRNRFAPQRRKGSGQ